MQEYIKMCEKAEKIQKIRYNYEIGDLSYDLSTQSFHSHGSENTGLGRATESVWLPRQDQLQRIWGEWHTTFGIKSKPKTWQKWLPHVFEKWLMDKDTDTECFLSMEQLWLAFVMKEKYNKIWDGKEWI